MLQLRIDDKVIKKLRELKLYPDTMLSYTFILLALREKNIGVLDALDDMSTSRRAFLMYQDLVRLGLIKEANGEENTPSIYKLTEKGEALLTELEQLVPAEDAPSLSPSQSEEEDVAEWMSKWMDLWPVGVTSGGKLVRSDKKSCVIKMKKFLKDYPEFNKDIIFKATQMYIDQFDLDNPQFMKCAVYFIDKRGEGSELAGWCEKAVNGTPNSDFSDVIYNSDLI